MVAEKDIQFLKGSLNLGDAILVSQKFGGGGSEGNVIEEIPSGLINGTNTDFTLSHTPIDHTLLIFLNGVEQSESVDYTLDGVTITFIEAPQSGDEVSVYYNY